MKLFGHRFVLAWYWNPRVWGVGFHSGRRRVSCCLFWMEFGPLEVGMGHRR